MFNFLLVQLKSNKNLVNLISTLSTHVAVVGAGPAGIYTTQYLIKNVSKIKVDLFEKLPVPFGLVRFGVAPDHPEVKNVTKTFTKVLEDPRVSFYGNVNLGRDIHLKELLSAYSTVVLAYGASLNREFSIPGENLGNVLASGHVINWYNGMPGFEKINLNLDVEECVVFGHGNVAADVARILLSPADLLQPTDITSYSMEKLRENRIRKVFLVGRRGPLQASFTTAEFRELTRIPDCDTHLREEDFKNIDQSSLEKLPRAKKRLIELQLKTLNAEKTPGKKELYIVYHRSPSSFHPSSPDHEQVDRVDLVKNQIQLLEGKAKAIPTEDKETIPTRLVVKSIGFKGEKVDTEIPFNQSRGVIPNTEGRVTSIKGLYCSGWIKTGPVGVIGSTLNSAHETGKIIIKDFNEGILLTGNEKNRDKLINKLKNKYLTFEDWKKIDKEEKRLGKINSKPREKIVKLDDIFKLLKK